MHSAVQKYSHVKQQDAFKAADEISALNGVDAWESKNPACMTDQDCQAVMPDSKCGVREGKSRGVCIPTWYGIVRLLSYLISQ